MNDARPVTAFIVEDEPLARRRLRELIRDVPWLSCAGEASSARAAIAAIDATKPDLLFLDVHMPGLSGLDVLAALVHRPAVIFTTAYDRFAVTAFELGAIDYLLKPFGRERFGRAIERARPLLDRGAGSAAARAQEILTPGPAARLFVRDAGRVVPVRMSAVERIEAADDFVIVHAGGRQFTLNLPLSDLDARLDASSFVRVHRSHIVNLDHVISWTPVDGSRIAIKLKSGATVLASRQRSRMLRELAR